MGRLLYSSLTSAQGPVSYGTDGEFVREVRLGDVRHDEGRRTPLDRETKRQLQQYFAGERRTFDLPFAVHGTPFSRDVLHAVANIAFGETISYGALADLVGRPRAARAVGNAVGANDLPLIIPCHRVLAAQRRLGGFGGGTTWKEFLLRLESVDYLPNR